MNRWVTAALVGPAILTTVVLLFIPLAIIVSYSFAARDAYGGIAPGFSTESYRELLQPTYLPILYNSLKLAAFSTVLCIAIGYPMAYYIAFKSGRTAAILLALLLIPFWIDFIIRISSWVVLLGRNGTINGVLGWTGLISEPVRMIGTYPAVLVGMLYAFLPTTVLPIYASLNGLDKKLLEAADDLGARPLEAFYRVTLPLSMPGIMAAMLFVFVPAMGVYAIPVLLGGGKSIIIGNLILQLFLDFRNLPLGAAVSVLLLAFCSVIIAFYLNFLRKIEERSL